MFRGCDGARRAPIDSSVLVNWSWRLVRCVVCDKPADADYLVLMQDTLARRANDLREGQKEWRLYDQREVGQLPYRYERVALFASTVDELC